MCNTRVEPMSNLFLSPSATGHFIEEVYCVFNHCMLYEVRADLTPHRSALDTIDPGTPTTGQLMGICCVTQSNPTNAIDLRALSDGDVIMVAALVVNNNNKQLFLSCEKEFSA